MTRLRIFAVLALAVLTAACGFQLRGQAKLPFDTLYVAFPEYSPLTMELKRNIIAGTSTAIVDDPTKAQAILSLVTEQRDKSILSFDTAGKVRELQLHYRLAFRVHDARGRDYVPRTEIRATRDISFSDTEVLSKESEEQLLYRDMQSDMVQQIVRRLAAAPAQPLGVEAGAKDAAAR